MADTRKKRKPVDYVEVTAEELYDECYIGHIPWEKWREFAQFVIDREMQMLTRIRGTLQARLEGHNAGGDSEIMRLVDEIVRKESKKV